MVGVAAAALGSLDGQSAWVCLVQHQVVVNCAWLRHFDDGSVVDDVPFFANL